MGWKVSNTLEGEDPSDYHWQRSLIYPTTYTLRCPNTNTGWIAKYSYGEFTLVLNAVGDRVEFKGDFDKYREEVKEELRHYW